MPKLSVINDKYGTGAVYEFDVSGDAPNDVEKKFIDSYLKDVGVVEKQLDMERIIDTSGVKDAGFRYGFANVDDDEERAGYLDKTVGPGNWLQRLDGTFALTPEGRAKIGQPGDVPLSIEDKGFSRYDFADFAGEGGLALGASVVAGVLTGGLALLPAVGVTALAGAGGKLVDEAIESARGLQRQSFRKVAKDALSEAAFAGTGEFSGRLITSTFGRLIKGGTTNAQRAEHRELLKWAKENDVQYVPDLASVSGKPLLARVQALTEQVLGNKRGPVIRESLDNLVQTISRTDGIPVEEAQTLVFNILNNKAELAKGAAKTVANDIAGVYGQSVAQLGDRAAAAIAAGNREELESVIKGLHALDAQSEIDLNAGYGIINTILNKDLDFLNSPAYRSLLEGKKIPLDDGEFVSPIRFARSVDPSTGDEIVEPLVVNVSDTIRMIDEIPEDRVFPDGTSVRDEFRRAFGFYDKAKENGNFISLNDYNRARSTLNRLVNTERGFAARRREAAPVETAPMIYRTLTDDFTKSLDNFDLTIQSLFDNVSTLTASEELVNAAAAALGREIPITGRLGQADLKRRTVSALKNKLSDIRSSLGAIKEMNGVYATQREIFEDANIRGVAARLKNIGSLQGDVIASDVAYLAEEVLRDPRKFDSLAKLFENPLRTKEQTSRVLSSLRENLIVRGRAEEVAAGIADLEKLIPEETVKFGGKMTQQRARDLLGNVVMNRLYRQAVDTTADGDEIVNILRFSTLAEKNRDAVRQVWGDRASAEFLDMADQIKGAYKEFSKELPERFNSAFNDIVNRGLTGKELQGKLRTLKDELAQTTKGAFQRALRDPENLNLENAASMMVAGKVPLQTVRETLDALKRDLGEEQFAVVEQSLKDTAVKRFFSNIAGNGDQVSDISTINPVDAVLNYRQLKNMLGTGAKQPTISRDTLEYIFTRGEVTGSEAVKSLENLAKFAENQAGRATSGKGTIAGANLGLALGAGILIDPITTLSSIAGLSVLSRFFSNPAFVRVMSRPKKESLRLLKQEEKGGIPEKAFLQLWANMTRSILSGTDDGSIPLSRDEVRAQQDRLDKILKIEQQGPPAQRPTVRRVPEAQPRIISPQPTPTPQPAVQPAPAPQPAPQAGIRTISAPAPAGISTALRQQTEQGLMQPYSGVGSVRV